MPTEPQPDMPIDPQPDKPLVGEKDRQWIEAMRAGDAMRWRQLRFETNDPARNGRAYESLMNSVLRLYGRLPASGPIDEETALRITQTLAGRKVDPAREPRPG